MTSRLLLKNESQRYNLIITKALQKLTGTVNFDHSGKALPAGSTRTKQMKEVTLRTVISVIACHFFRILGKAYLKNDTKKETNNPGHVKEGVPDRKENV